MLAMFMGITIRFRRCSGTDLALGKTDFLFLFSGDALREGLVSGAGASSSTLTGGAGREDLALEERDACRRMLRTLARCSRRLEMKVRKREDAGFYTLDVLTSAFSEVLEASEDASARASDSQLYG